MDDGRKAYLLGSLVDVLSSEIREEALLKREFLTEDEDDELRAYVIGMLNREIEILNTPVPPHNLRGIVRDND